MSVRINIPVVGHRRSAQKTKDVAGHIGACGQYIRAE